MKPSLQDIQSDFYRYIVGDGEGTPAIAAAIVDGNGLRADRRLGIYYNAYRLRICEALSTAYDKTHALIGDELFEEMCLDYIDTYPSTTSNMRWYGDRFACHLAACVPDHPVIAELAAFEWTLGLTFDADDADVLQAEQIAAIAPEQWDTVGFALHPSVRFMSMHTNAIAIWLSLDKDDVPPGTQTNDDAVEWLLWRKELQPHFRSLHRYEAHALRSLQQGKSFSTVCAEIANLTANADDGVDVMARIAAWMQTWLVEGVLSAVVTGTVEPA